ncbi:MAG: hypothetical protein LBM16_03965, partial [Clostridiales bacterium]|nr:hypothetical protein [Clostridiales bacterium]
MSFIKKKKFTVTILAVIVVHLLATLIHEGHPTDISCFKGWAIRLFEGGFANFYTSGGFSDYPP